MRLFGPLFFRRGRNGLRKRWLKAAISAVVVGLLAVACGEAESVDTSGALIVYSGRSESLVGPIIQQFAASTGVDVSVKYGSTGGLVATLLEEGHNTPADVFFAQDQGGLGSVEKMMAILPSSILGLVPTWAQSPHGHWVGVSGRARVVTYNTDRLTEDDLPGDIWDFIDPQWRGRIGLPPTNGSFQTMVTGMRAIWGAERARQWLEGILANDPVYYSNNTATVAATAAGEVEVGLVNHYYLHRFLAEEGASFAARNYHPRVGGPGALVIVAGTGILSTAENPTQAERFVEFLLSTVAQQYFVSQTFEYPLVMGVPTPPGLVPLAEINQPLVSVEDLVDLVETQAMLREVGLLP